MSELIVTSGDEYEYRAMVATEWDLTRPNAPNWPDVPFYRKLIKECGQPVLDVACATGRLVIKFASEGLDIDGVDISPEMLRICRSKAAEAGLNPGLHLQPMQDLDLPRKYRTIIVSSGSFALLTEPENARRALRGMFRHLETGGSLAMTLNIYHPGQEKDDWVLYGEYGRDDGTTIRVWEKSWTDHGAMLAHTETRFEVMRDEQVEAVEHHRRSPELRWYTRAEITELVGGAGFQITAVTDGFANHPLVEADKSMMVIATKP